MNALQVSSWSTQDILETLAILPPHNPLYEPLFAELRRRRGPVAPPQKPKVPLLIKPKKSSSAEF